MWLLLRLESMCFKKIALYAFDLIVGFDLCLTPFQGAWTIRWLFLSIIHQWTSDILLIWTYIAVLRVKMLTSSLILSSGGYLLITNVILRTPFRIYHVETKTFVGHVPLDVSMLPAIPQANHFSCFRVQNPDLTSYFGFGFWTWCRHTVTVYWEHGNFQTFHGIIVSVALITLTLMFGIFVICRTFWQNLAVYVQL